ncbi:MAG: hypothetical protein A2W00_06445 [Candidatus Eisenbacteria bacterium RBG_16_71_46]|nr:MAG: hypothetical protein A2W00_06445 [Candidatus Eisenbacteria bacterium RBG_16_71_46]
MAQKRNSRKAERRGRPRADVRLSMRLEGAPEDGAQAQIVTESQNISASGVYCHSSHYLAPASKVAMTLVLPRMPGAGTVQELIKCEGIVVRCEPSRAGRGDAGFQIACAFSGLDERRRLLIDEFVTWRNVQALRAATRAAGSPRRKTIRSGPARPGAARGSAAGGRAGARRRTMH